MTRVGDVLEVDEERRAAVGEFVDDRLAGHPALADAGVAVDAVDHPGVEQGAVVVAVQD